MHGEKGTECDRRRAAEIYVKAENSKLEIDFVTDVPGEAELDLGIAPRHSLDLAKFLVRTGLVKSSSVDWRDYFFPEIHGEDGS